MMLPHEQRVVDELKQLNDKRQKLALFIGGSVFVGLPTDEQDRLCRQLRLMMQYEGVLRERIEHFPEHGPVPLARE